MENKKITLEIELLEDRIAPGAVANINAITHAGPAAGTIAAPIGVSNWFGVAASGAGPHNC